MNHKRGRPRKQVRCRLCTDSRDYTGGDRLRERKLAFDLEEKANAEDGTVDCPDCGGTGRCDDCPDNVCVLCGGSGVYDMT